MELYPTPRFGDVARSPKAYLTDSRSLETPAGPHYDPYFAKLARSRAEVDEWIAYPAPAHDHDDLQHPS